MCEKLDVLNREDFIHKLKTLVAMLADSGQGCSFGIDGAWGSGKSFVLEKFEKEIKDIVDESTYDNKYCVFHYDCWKYDYYDEPAIAIVASMLDATDKELSAFPEDARNAGKLSLEAVKTTLSKMASELCKNKIGIDLVEIASEVLEKHDDSEINDFDSLYGFKRALEEARSGIREISQTKTVVVVVDELDRCLPEYAIKVLERLHHIFVDIDNVIVIVSMDKSQLEHSIKGIYGNIEVDKYLRKFISFKVDLDNGKPSNYADKFNSYFSMFDISPIEGGEIEQFLSNILINLDMRTQERIFKKAEIIHTIVKDDEIKDCSIMTFEILYLTVAFKTGSKNLDWLSTIWKVTQVDYERKLGKKYYSLLNEYGKNCITSGRRNNEYIYINDNLIGKTFFWLRNLYSNYKDGVCAPYYYNKQAEKSVELVHRFRNIVNIIDTD